VDHLLSKELYYLGTVVPCPATLWWVLVECASVMLPTLFV